MQPITVLIVDDHPLMRQSLLNTFLTETDITVVGEACDGFQALAQLAVLQPDIVLLDLMLPGKDGFDVLAEMKEHAPDTRALVLSSAQEEGKIRRAVELGATGYLTKNARRQEVLAAVRAIHAGNGYLPPDVAAKLMRNVREHGDEAQSNGDARPGLDMSSLTRRERQIFELMGQGMNTKQMAETLSVSAVTVRVHMRHVLQKLGFVTRQEAMVYAARRQKTAE